MKISLDEQIKWIEHKVENIKELEDAEAADLKYLLKRYEAILESLNRLKQLEK